MRAIQVSRFGGPEVLRLEEVPDPVAGPGQVVVEMAAADVIFLDTLLRGGWGGDFFPLELPYVPGGGGAGRVLSVGEGVDPGWVGHHVVARASAFGGYAERMVAAAEGIVAVPDGVDSTSAAAMTHDGATAVGLVRQAKPGEGERVLVAAATGGAGSLLVQLARDAGARVVAAARGERKLALARELGAEVTVDYSEPDWQHRVREEVGGVDLAFDGAGGELGRSVFETVVEGGRFVTYGTSDGFTTIDPGVAEERQVQVTNALGSGPAGPAAVRELLTEALTLAARGRLRPVIGATYPLAQAKDAHTSLAERATLGKSLLLP